ncbi:MAG: arginine N-succinyltransferase [Phenylobacterium sp.]|uniref:arginine N-succinyltransferase n=1 Tax=Phenylobacterium sp. TaxID=1871053 RepID=UPI00391A0F6B
MTVGATFVRPARRTDLDGLLALARQAGLGMTNLPPCGDKLSRLLAASEALLERPARTGAQLVLVLEHEGRVVGTGCVFPAIGVDFPFYSYRISRLRQTSQALGKSMENVLLTPVNEYDGCAEVGGLFLSPDHRHAGAGRLMARSRYLFIAEHRDWFADRVISELRGYQDEEGRFPFWEGVAKPFYDMEFAEADRLSVGPGKQVIADLGPKYPIYLNLLPPEAAKAVGACHPDGRRAKALLEEEGFRFEGCIDIFDGGPTLAADIDQLKAVRERRTSRVAGVESYEEGHDLLVSKGSGEAFRAARGRCAPSSEGLVVSPELAEALQISKGDEVRHVAF